MQDVDCDSFNNSALLLNLGTTSMIRWRGVWSRSMFQRKRKCGKEENREEGKARFIRSKKIRTTAIQQIVQPDRLRIWNGKNNHSHPVIVDFRHTLFQNTVQLIRIGLVAFFIPLWITSVSSPVSTGTRCLHWAPVESMKSWWFWSWHTTPPHSCRRKRTPLHGHLCV